jgi:uncharacterized protein YecT (DUF1311 family)
MYECCIGIKSTTKFGAHRTSHLTSISHLTSKPTHDASRHPARWWRWEDVRALYRAQEAWLRCRLEAYAGGGYDVGRTVCYYLPHRTSHLTAISHLTSKPTHDASRHPARWWRWEDVRALYRAQEAWLRCRLEAYAGGGYDVGRTVCYYPPPLQKN